MYKDSSCSSSSFFRMTPQFNYIDVSPKLSSLTIYSEIYLHLHIICNDYPTEILRRGQRMHAPFLPPPPKQTTLSLYMVFHHRRYLNQFLFLLHDTWRGHLFAPHLLDNSNNIDNNNYKNNNLHLSLPNYCTSLHHNILKTGIGFQSK